MVCTLSIYRSLSFFLKSVSVSLGVSVDSSVLAVPERRRQVLAALVLPPHLPIRQWWGGIAGSACQGYVEKTGPRLQEARRPSSLTTRLVEEQVRNIFNLKQKRRNPITRPNKYLSKMVQQAGGRADVGPAAVFPARVQPLVVVGLPRLTRDQHHIEVFLGSSQPLGQNAAVALIHKQQDTSGLAASQVG